MSVGRFLTIVPTKRHFARPLCPIFPAVKLVLKAREQAEHGGAVVSASMGEAPPLLPRGLAVGRRGSQGDFGRVVVETKRQMHIAGHEGKRVHRAAGALDAG